MGQAAPVVALRKNLESGCGDAQKGRVGVYIRSGAAWCVATLRANPEHGAKAAAPVRPRSPPALGYSAAAAAAFAPLPNHRHRFLGPFAGVVSISIDGVTISVSTVAKARPKTKAEEKAIHHCVEGAP